MTRLDNKRKMMVLCFRGFNLPVDEVELLVGKTASSRGVKGMAVKPGVKTILKRSFVRYAFELEDDCRLDEMVPRLFEFCGGVENIRTARDKILPEFIDVDITLPVRDSDEQGGGFISTETLANLAVLGAALSFRFV